jgi:hypothetical protein
MKPTPQLICAKLKAFLQNQDYERSSGEFEFIQGDYAFYIDYIMRDGEAEYSCPTLYFNGDRIDFETELYFEMNAQPEWIEGTDDFKQFGWQ